MKVLVLILLVLATLQTQAQSYLFTQDSVFRCILIESKGNKIKIYLADSYSTAVNGEVERFFNSESRVDLIVFADSKSMNKFFFRNQLTGIEVLLSDEKKREFLDSLQNGPIDLVAIRYKLDLASPALIDLGVERIEFATSIESDANDLVKASAIQLDRFRRRQVGAIIVSAITTTVVVVLPLVVTGIAPLVLVRLAVGGTLISMALELSSFTSMALASKYLEAASRKIVTK